MAKLREMNQKQKHKELIKEHMELINQYEDLRKAVLNLLDIQCNRCSVDHNKFAMQ